MADLNRDSIADMAQNRADINSGTTGNLRQVAWENEDPYWRDNYARRPYAAADRDYEFYRPAYRYGTESAGRIHGRSWNEAESELQRGWDKARGASKSTWEDVKDAVRDAWDRVTGSASTHR